MKEDAWLADKIRLHHATVSDLSALADRSIQVVYTAERALHELLRVLAPGGFVFSRVSAGVLEQRLGQSCRTLLDTPLVSVFERGEPRA